MPSRVQERPAFFISKLGSGRCPAGHGGTEPPSCVGPGKAWASPHPLSAQGPVGTGLSPLGLYVPVMGKSEHGGVAGPSRSVAHPFQSGELRPGTWQQCLWVTVHAGGPAGIGTPTPSCCGCRLCLDTEHFALGGCTVRACRWPGRTRGPLSLAGTGQVWGENRPSQGAQGSSTYSLLRLPGGRGQGSRVPCDHSQLPAAVWPVPRGVQSRAARCP